MWLRILFVLCCFLPTILFAQSNGIFGGGNGDGFSVVCFLQTSNNSIFAGNTDDGFVEACFLQASNNGIFAGGNADGFVEICFLQNANNLIFTGGTNDGFAEACFQQISQNNIFGGGTNDGFAERCFLQASGNSIFSGGSDDGFAMLCFIQPASNPIFGGGTDDGFDQLCFLQASNNSIFAGGTDDGFSFFQIIPTPIFPVEFLSFDGEYINGDAWLSWATALEINNSHFVLERSLDGRLFQSVATIPGAGTTSEIQTYDYYDPIDFLAETYDRVYYRLQQVDFDGNFEHSNIVELKLDNAANAVSAFPNPADQEVFIQFRNAVAAPVQIDLYDLSGRKVRTYRFEGGTPQRRFALDLGELPEGVYPCRIHVPGDDGVQEAINILIHH
ncbi:MAG: T9SS type A sorting domain-containing protein [Bacteroidota bacterium]